jgi:flagellar hook-associated protein 3 FlgL
MKTASVSTLSLFDASRAAIMRNQARLADAQIEVSTGRYADIGKALGIDASRNLELRNARDDLSALQSTNGVVSTRLNQTQTALAAIKDLADGFMQTALASSQSGGDRSLLVADAKSRLGALVDILSTTSNGVFIFGGTNASNPPVPDYLAQPPSAGRTAVTGAFTTEFGVAPGNPLAKSITAGQMKTYLDGTFAALFQDAAWSGTFSSANSNVMSDRISAGEVIDTSVSANAGGFRKLVLVLTAAVDSGTENLNADAFSELSKTLVQASGEASSSITGMQSKLGISQERLAKASDRIVVQQNILEQRIGQAESVDTAKAATSLSTITAQLEASYAVTARLQKLSLLNYLPLA